MAIPCFYHSSAVSHNLYQKKVDKLVDVGTLSKLLDIIPSFNHFEFNNAHYLQTYGTAMGIKMALNYSIIFMGVLENSLLHRKSCLFSIEDI